MGIISINDKRTTTNRTHTTGKEKSYFVSDQFPSVFAKITGKIFSWGNSNATSFGGFGAFWENTDGTIVDLKMAIGTMTPVNEQGSRINSSASEAWYDLEIDLRDASDGRLIFYAYKNYNNFESDVDLDDIALVSTSGTINNFDPSVQLIRTGNKWQNSTTRTMSSYATAKQQYSQANFNDMGDSTGNAHCTWNYVTGAGGGSGGTGSDNAADNNNSTYYVYFEASSQSGNYGKGSYLRWKNNYSLTTGLEL